ncbi:hypothetical protein BDW60DRAFT_187338 [Aspergillus nidulans var. acristatus]
MVEILIGVWILFGVAILAQGQPLSGKNGVRPRRKFKGPSSLRCCPLRPLCYLRAKRVILVRRGTFRYPS